MRIVRGYSTVLARTATDSILNVSGDIVLTWLKSDSRIVPLADPAPTASPLIGPTGKPLGVMSFLVLSAWCGLVAGLLEVATIVVRKEFFDANHLYGMSRHFTWLIPLTNLGVFLTIGLGGWGVSRIWRRSGSWLVARGMCALVLLPVFLIAFPRIYTFAWLAVALGIAVRLVPMIAARPQGFRRFVQLSFPPAVAILSFLGASPCVSDRIKLSRESARPLPLPKSPNLILIVLDTVAASHLSVYGYERPTSTTLVEVAEQGIRFDSARAPSSWTLPSHATMFTGRWMHELSVGWLNPLDGGRPTLAEFLGTRGYATAGFVANTMFCATDTGLARGFTHYEDFIFPEYTALKTAVIVHRVLAVFGRILPFVEDRPALSWLRPYVQRIWRAFVFDRKGAARVNREFLRWLSGRTQPERPFFAFLNYSDAHTPYEISDGRVHRFGIASPDERQRELIRRWGDLDKVRLASQDLPVVVDAYDDCIADLDEQLGKLLDRLRRQGILDKTWLMIASDHGESFGEHTGVFCHGTSLYQTEVHVPLLIVPPGGCATRRVVKETVSLRDLAATIVDVLDLANGSPFPGDSLARFWRDRAPTPALEAASEGLILSEVIPGFAINVDVYGLPKKSWPLAALHDGEWSYIRSEGNVREELFHVSKDTGEQRNMARDPAAQPILERLRRTLMRLTNGPLTQDRFNR
jgi:arylsulfatase A-like enzyme